MLALDALHGVPPTILAVLGTGRSVLDLGAFHKPRELVFRHLRDRWPECAYAWQLEYTEGLSARSQGRQFPHWNVPIKGVPLDAFDEAREIIVGTWCRSAPNAGRSAQYVAPFRDAAAFMRYCFDHFGKVSQRPPAGFRGRRFDASRNYLWLPRAEAREATRASLAAKRAMWAARQELGEKADAYDLELRAREIEAENAATDWDLVELVQVGGLTVDIRSFDEPHRGRSYRPPAGTAAPRRTN